MLGFGAIGEAPLGGLPNRVIEQIRSGGNVATLTISSLIVPARQDAEGVLVKSYGALWLEMARQLGTDWTKAFDLSPRQWEEMLAGAFDKEVIR